MGAQGRAGVRLFRFDGRIAVNTIRANFNAWPDRLIAGALLLAGLAVLRSCIAGRPWKVAALAAIGAGLMIGIGAGRAIAARLAFHASDGLLAADALHPPARRRYRLAWHSVGAAVSAGMTLIARPSLLIVIVPAYLIGALAAGLWPSFSVPLRAADTARPGWALRDWLRRPRADIAAAVVLLLSLLSARTLGDDAAFIAAGVGTLVLSLALTPVDDRKVRFMAIAGHGAGSTIRRHSGGFFAFVAIAAPVGWLTAGLMAAGVVAAVAALALLLLALRVLAYRLHDRRFGDLLVSISVALLALAAYAVPIAFPMAVVAIVWPLQRRGAAKTWLLT